MLCPKVQDSDPTFITVECLLCVCKNFFIFIHAAKFLTGHIQRLNCHFNPYIRLHPYQNHFSTSACLLIEGHFSYLKPVSPPPRMFVKQGIIPNDCCLSVVNTTVTVHLGKDRLRLCFVSRNAASTAQLAFIIYLNGWLSHHHLLRM